MKKRDYRKELGAELRRLRLAVGLTQWEVAEQLGYSTAQFVSNWERGISVPPYSAVPALAATLGASPVDLVELMIGAERAELEAKRRRMLKELRLERAVVLKELRA